MLIQYLSLLIHWTPLLQWPLPSPSLQHWFPWLNCLEVGITTCSILPIIQISSLTLFIHHLSPFQFMLLGSLHPATYCSFFPRINFNSATTLTPCIHTQLSFSSLSTEHVCKFPNFGSNQFFIHFFSSPWMAEVRQKRQNQSHFKFLITKTKWARQVTQFCNSSSGHSVFYSPK